jgi:putative Holliday junction resolvase
MHDRWLGIDYGTVRIGLAISDPLGITAQPVGVVPNSDTALAAICQIIQERSVKKCIIGLPKDRQGNDSAMAERIRAFAESLQHRAGVPIEWVDERFSTVAATRQLRAAGISAKHQRQHIDTQAAMFLLQGVLDRA